VWVVCDAARDSEADTERWRHLLHCEGALAGNR
jgi:hypothetical protein